MNSATDTIRAMLDERGVEHFDGAEGTYWGGSVLARNGLNPVYRFSARESVGGLNVHLLRVTPEQAIEATLGSAENAELRKERDALDHLTDVLNDSNDGLLAENAKLRELLAELYEDQCDECDEWKYADRMRELGVEV